MRVRAWVCAIGVATSLHAAAAASCNLPLPFQYEFQNAVSATLTPDAANACVLTVSTNSGAGATAAAFLHYQLPQPSTHVRYGFRVDSSALTLSTATQALQLFAATAATRLLATAHLADVWLSGGATPTFRLHAADNATPGGLTTVVVPLAQSVNVVRLEIAVGAGTAGVVRYWINHAFTDPPDGVIDHAGAGLDNAGWSGVIAAEVGLSSSSPVYRSSNAAANVVFDQIETDDDLVFFDDFTIGAQQ